jgi:vacuolar protein sorting-associated protein 51
VVNEIASTIRVRIYTRRCRRDASHHESRGTLSAHPSTSHLSRMSPTDSQPSTPTLASPPRPRSLNKVLPSPLRPNSALAPQPSSSPRPTALSIASPTTTPPERSKTKAMDLLRKHYGLSVTPPPPSGRPTDPLDLGQSYSRNILPRSFNKISDSPAFDSKAYYGQLITTASLTTLLKKENELLTGELFLDHVAYSRLYKSSCPEMRQLGNERQALVYNHHHELIDATDTISAVSMLVSLASSATLMHAS